MQTLAAVLDVEKVGVDEFRGRTPSSSAPRVFGGQLVGQAVVAAGAAMGVDWVPYSAHAHFLRPGAATEPLIYRVEDVRDGRTAAVRRVTAEQGRALCTVTVAFARPGPDPERERPDPAPVGFPGGGPDRAAVDVPDSVGADAEGPLAGVDGRTRDWLASLRRTLPLEVRFLEPPARDAVLRGVRPPPRQRIFVRAAGALPDDPLIHAAALAYVSDLFLLSTALLPHGLLMGDPNVHAVSLDHAVWFHDATRVDEWVLYTMESPWTGSGRAFCRGEMRDAAGRTVASTAQEGTVRVIGL